MTPPSSAHPETTVKGRALVWDWTLDLANGDTLTEGDTFSMKGEGEDGARGYFKFMARRLHEFGEDSVLCFGGDKPSTDPNRIGRRAWRAFCTDRVIADARAEPSFDKRVST